MICEKEYLEKRLLSLIQKHYDTVWFWPDLATSQSLKAFDIFIKLVK